jgi:hypothetical protein
MDAGYNGMIDYFTHLFNYRIRGISAGGVTGVDDLGKEWQEDGNDWNRNDQPINEEGYATDLGALNAPLRGSKSSLYGGDPGAGLHVVPRKNQVWDRGR